jgi:hypothetical protein
MCVFVVCAFGENQSFFEIGMLEHVFRLSLAMAFLALPPTELLAPALLARPAVATTKAPNSRFMAPQPEFTLSIPSEFVQIPKTGRSSSNFLLSSGNFATGSTLTVQAIEVPQLMPDGIRAEDAVYELSAALVRLRDSQSGIDATSTMRTPGPTLSSPFQLDFEFDTPLVSPPQDDPELSRRTVARALLLPDADGGAAGAAKAPIKRVLVAWGGAKRSEWDAGVGEVLRNSIATFSPIAGAGSGPGEP